MREKIEIRSCIYSSSFPINPKVIECNYRGKCYFQEQIGIYSPGSEAKDAAICSLEIKPSQPRLRVVREGTIDERILH